MAKGLEVEAAVGGKPSPAPSGALGVAPGAREALRRDDEARPGALHGDSFGDDGSDTTVGRRSDRKPADRTGLDSRRALDEALGRRGPTVADPGPRVGVPSAAACARGPDGLTAAERRAVASDSSAAPALPPTTVPARPEPANAALGKMLDAVELDGVPLDLATLAAGVRRRTDSARPVSGSGPAADDRSRAGSWRPSPAGGLPSAHPDASARLTIATRGAPASPGGAGAAPPGAHDRVESGAPLDAMRFNWDAFFARFLLRATADAQAWRRMAAELRQMAARTGVAMQRADAELLGARQALERAEALRSLAESLARAAGAAGVDAGTSAPARTDPTGTAGTAAAPTSAGAASRELHDPDARPSADPPGRADDPAAPEPHDSLARVVAEAVTAGLDELPGSAEGLAERAARRTVVLAQGDRDRLDAVVRESMGRAHGMLAQLARLLGASRGR